MPVRVGRSVFGDCCHRGVVCSVVVPDDHGEATSRLAIREPVRSHSGGLETRHDLVQHVGDPGIEVGGRLVLKGHARSNSSNVSLTLCVVGCPTHHRVGNAASARRIMQLIAVLRLVRSSVN